MSHEILSAKLYELDREFGLLHGSIQLSETASREQLGQELARLRQKNEADRLAFQTKLKFSRSPMVGKLASSYETIEAFIDRERAEQDGPFSEVWRRGLSAEEALLLAEYSLDFASRPPITPCFSPWKQSARRIYRGERKRRLSKMRCRSKFGWMELMIGILLIVLGIFTFLRPGSVLTGAVLVYGVFALITGIADIVFYVKMERHTGFGPVVALVSGILSVIAGLLVMVYPGAAAWALTIFFPLWFIMHCISRLTHLGIIRYVAGSGYYYFSLILNIIGLVLGFLMLLQPALAFLSMGFVIGAYLILLGIDSLVLAFSDVGYKW
ncbi:HdeD family acid-resistance protein [Oscillibacter valericigenes]|nr:HdeD family acid-resistance protein [Oscillibacter valericigenes]